MNRLSALLATSILMVTLGWAQAQDATQHTGCVDLSEPGFETTPARGPDPGTAAGRVGPTGEDEGGRVQAERTAAPTPRPPIAGDPDAIRSTHDSHAPAMQAPAKRPAEDRQQHATSAPC